MANLHKKTRIPQLRGIRVFLLFFQLQASCGRILPSAVNVTTRMGMSFPLAATACRAAYSSPPQHGTSMRVSVTLRTSFSVRMAVSFFRIVRAVELRTADERDAAADKVRMEAAAGVSRAVGGDQQVAAVKIRCTHRYELQLHRPVLQTARLRGRVLSGGLLRKRPYLRPGAAAGQPVRCACARLFCRLHAPDRLLRQPFELRFLTASSSYAAASRSIKRIASTGQTGRQLPSPSQ